MKTKQINKSITEINKCTGCSACMNICPAGAISMGENIVGHLLPKINESLCVDCNLCVQVCPSNSPVHVNFPIKTYAAWALDDEEYNSSTSGGVAAVLSRYIVENEGVVYGCICKSGGIIMHDRISSVKDLEKLKGSKYVQSDIGTAYQSVKKDLNLGLDVLFTGTPCQIAGLKKFLKREHDNLYTLDLICHGVPSQKLLFEHLNSKGIDRKDVNSVRFRERKGCYLSVNCHGEIVYRKSDLDDLYYQGFYDGLISRDSCATCIYAKNERVGDITLGDFHRLGKVIPCDVPHKDSASVVLVNSKKGNTLIANCKDKMFMIERTFNEAKNGNPQLCHPYARKENFDKFVSAYRKYGFRKAANKSLLVRRIKDAILKIIQRK